MYPTNARLGVFMVKIKRLNDRNPARKSGTLTSLIHLVLFSIRGVILPPSEL